MKSPGYAHPELLVETEWLVEHIEDPNVRVVDMGNPDGYVRAHIPGAVHIGPGRSNFIKDDPDDPVYVMPPDKFAALMGSFGIGDDTTVIVYDADGANPATRLWWALEYYGNHNCRVLNGGWNKWVAERRPAAMEVPEYPAATFTTRVDDSLICRVEELKSYVGDKGTALWDVRSQGEWDGSVSRGNNRTGHIPGAIHLEWSAAVATNRDLATFKSPEELRTLLEKTGITEDKLVVTY